MNSLIIVALVLVQLATPSRAAAPVTPTPEPSATPTMAGMDDHEAPIVPRARTAYNAHVRREPRISRPRTANSIMVLPKGTEVQVHGQQHDRTWYHVITPDGATGWMHHTVLHLTPEQLAAVPVNEAQTAQPVALVETTTAVPLVTVTIALQVCTDLNGSGLEACDEAEGVRNVPVQVTDLSSFEPIGPRGLTDARGVLRLTVQAHLDAELFISAPSLPWSETMRIRDGEAPVLPPIVLDQPAVFPWLLP